MDPDDIRCILATAEARRNKAFWEYVRTFYLLARKALTYVFK